MLVCPLERSSNWFVPSTGPVPKVDVTNCVLPIDSHEERLAGSKLGLSKAMTGAVPSPSGRRTLVCAVSSRKVKRRRPASIAERMAGAKPVICRLAGG